MLLRKHFPHPGLSPPLPTHYHSYYHYYNMFSMKTVLILLLAMLVAASSASSDESPRGLLRAGTAVASKLTTEDSSAADAAHPATDEEIAAARTEFALVETADGEVRSL
jgi:hypothetical protein